MSQNYPDGKINTNTIDGYSENIGVCESCAIHVPATKNHVCIIHFAIDFAIHS